MLDDVILEKKLVLGEGPKQCEICIIGEAPGREEEEKGRPFVGAAGRKLDEMLAKAGILRQSCYITNVVKERPPNNDISRFIQFKGGKVGVATTPEYDAYERALIDELQSIKCNLIVVLGNVPLYALTRNLSITKWRGSIISTADHTGLFKKVIPTIHPAALLRQEEFRPLVKRDMERIALESKFEEIRITPRIARTNPTFEEAMDYMRSISGLTATDIEVSGYTMSCFGLSKSPTDAMCIPLRGKLGNYWTEEEECLIIKEYARILQDPSITKIFHNSAFDCFFLYEQYGILVVNYEDTMIATAIMYTGLPKSLAFCTSFFTDIPFYKDEKLEDPDSKEYLHADLNRFWVYNCKDCWSPHEFWPRLEASLKRYKNWETYKAQLSTVNSIIYMQARGLRLDTEAAAEHRKILEKDIEETEATIRETVRTRLMTLPEAMWIKHGPSVETVMKKVLPKLTTSPKQKQIYFYGILGLPSYRNKNDKVTCDGHALRKIATKKFPEALMMADLMKKRKLKSSYIDIELDADQRLRGTYNPVGTGSGRFSASTLWRGSFWTEKKEVGLNIQTLPSSYKKYVKADEGCILVNIDLEQAENRIVAWVGNVPRMKHAFQNNIDVHKLTAALIFGIPIDSVSDEVGSSPIAGGTKSQRYWGKQCNHAFNYGRGPHQFAEQFGLSFSEAKELIARYFIAYPEVRSIYQATIESSIKRTRTVTTPFGRTRHFFGFIGSDTFREGYSYIPQETFARQINGLGLVPLVMERERYSALECLLQGHDAILVQAHLKCGIPTIISQLQDLKKSLETPIPWGDPFVIPAGFKVGLNYGERPKDKPEANLTGLRSFKIEDLANVVSTLYEEMQAEALCKATKITLDIESDDDESEGDE